MTPLLNTCPHCHAECGIPSDSVGNDVQCPHCSKEFKAGPLKAETSAAKTIFETLAKHLFAILVAIAFVSAAVLSIKPTVQDSSQHLPQQTQDPQNQAQPQMQKPLDTEDFDARMEAKALIRKRAASDYGNGSDGSKTTPPKYEISSERAEKYLGPSAQEEMREYLKQHGNPNPSQSDIDVYLKLNERLEHHTERAKIHPDEYK